MSKFKVKDQVKVSVGSYFYDQAPGLTGTVVRTQTVVRKTLGGLERDDIWVTVVFNKDGHLYRDDYPDTDLEMAT